MKRGRLSSIIKSRITNNEIFDNVFDTYMSFLNEDTEFALELSDETAPAEMGVLEEE
ncbi:MAG: hypothetical protein GXY91_03685 [Clostridia bacterium]|nr:hypothetical protein [Clostridia bacterium]